MIDDLELCRGFTATGTTLLSRGCRPAPCCAAMLDEATRRWPARSRASDGIVGDQAHSARTSDHNCAADGFAHAVDLTHDPGVGVDTYRLADQLRLRAQAGQEPRIKYVISNRRIASPDAGWAWRSYTGSNPHDHHFHVSVTPAATHDGSRWFAFLDATEPPVDALPAGWLAGVAGNVAGLRAVLG